MKKKWQVDNRWDFIQKYGVDLTWEKIVALDPRGTDETFVTATYGAFGVNPKGNPVKNHSVTVAIDELMKQVELFENPPISNGSAVLS